MFSFFIVPFLIFYLSPVFDFFFSNTRLSFTALLLI